MTMSTATPARIIELWPSLRPEVREAISEIVEQAAAPHQVHLSNEQRAAVERSKQDFAEGRSFSLDEADEQLDALLAPLQGQR
jgi:hypothetical protein